MPISLHRETLAGSPVIFDRLRLVPFHHVWRAELRLPFPGGGWQASLVWNRPSAVWARDAQGAEQVLPVPDVTRRWLWFILGGAAAWIVLRRFLQGVKP